MTRTLLIATVAALAITAPASAQDRRERGKHDERAETSKAPRADRQERAPRAERQQAAPRIERRVERQETAPRIERRVERQERAPLMERRVERPDRAPRLQRRIIEREQRAPRAERRMVERQSRQVENRVEAANRTLVRQARQAENRAEATDRTIVRRARQAENRVEATNRTIVRRARQAENRVEAGNRTIERRVRQELRADQRLGMWDNLAQPRLARTDADRSERRIARIGQRIDAVRYDDSVPLLYRARYQDTPDYYYRYNDDGDYLYQVRRDDNIVSALVPLLGGAYSVGRPLPLSYSSYNVPYGYRSLYYDTPDHYYRYGSGAIYQVDSGTNLIQAIVALLTGQSFGVGQMLPAGFNTYNVPYAYRDRYYDTDDSWYRYNDGNIYQIDPRTRLIEDMYPLSYAGFAVGSPLPYGYDDYNVPYGYRDLYYDTPDYNYRYANGGIYQVDPTTQVIQALVALVTGQSYNVGQALPATYSVYNVPYDYRDRYHDTTDNWYRYSDGMIYQVDPRTRLIRDAYSIYA